MRMIFSKTFVFLTQGKSLGVDVESKVLDDKIFELKKVLEFKVGAFIYHKKFKLIACAEPALTAI